MVLRNKRKQKTVALLLLVLLVGVGLGGILLTEIANIQAEEPLEYGVLFTAERFVDDTTTRWSAWAWDESGDTSPSELGGWFSSSITAYGIAEEDIGGKSDFQNAKIKGTLWINVWMTKPATRVLLKAENSTHTFTASNLDSLGTVDPGTQWSGGLNTELISDGFYTFTLIAVMADGEVPLIVFGMDFSEGIATVIPDYSILLLLGVICIGAVIIILLKRERKRR